MIWDDTRIILFGGFTGTHNAETWKYENNDWTQLIPATSPSSRVYHRMVWDGSRILMFGGTRPGTAFLADTWKFESGTWTQLFPAHSPSGRYWHSMVWDGSRVLLYGGTTIAGSTPNNEIWEYVAGDWNQLFPANSPPNVDGAIAAFTGRLAHRLVWNGTRAVFHSGRSTSNVYPSNPYYESGGGTWVYETADWSQPGPATDPGARYGYVMTVTDDDGKAILYSGDVSPTGSLGEIVDPATWTYDDTDWTDLALAAHPGSVLDSDMVWDTIGRRAILFGGEKYTSPTVHAPSAETWELAGPPFILSASIRHTYGLA